MTTHPADPSTPAWPPRSAPKISAHGIAVRRTLDPSPAGTHAAMIRAELAARFPAGLGSYVLWATSGDAYALHCSDPATAAAVAAACDAASSRRAVPGPS